MKRSEMIDHIKEVMLEAYRQRRYSREEDDKYFYRKAEDMLAMLLGLGMQPPLVEWQGELPLNFDMPIRGYHWEKE
jgi:hypothetical protein